MNRAAGRVIGTVAPSLYHPVPLVEHTALYRVE